jgi:hypothetical protein
MSANPDSKSGQPHSFEYFGRRMDEKFKNLSDRLGKAGERMNQKIGSVSEHLDQDTEHIVNYINDEVVPAVRSHSTKALRIASEQLSKLADYLDQQSRKP